MKVQFDIKFRPQIESGEYKVVTGDNRPVRIISWDKKVFGGRFEIVGLVPTPQGDTETAQLYCPDGTLVASGWNEKFKLFIITPEPELTEFEQKVRDYIIENLTTHGRESSSAVFIGDDTAKKMAAELLELARKEIMDGWSKGLRDTQDRSGKAYNDGYKLGLEEGKAEALKDLPRWIPNKFDKHNFETCKAYLDTPQYLCYQNKMIDVSELVEKLPGFKEDEK